MIEKDVLDPDRIKEGLNTQIIGKEIYCFRETNSTQAVAQELANNGSREGTVILAEEQTQGRGRMGRNWFSPPGKGIWASVILRPPLPPSQAGKVALTSAIAIAEAIREVTGLPALIKWPNDLLIQGKKVGGILTEMSAETDLVKFIITGLGINVNLDTFSEKLNGKATSLKRERGEEVSRLLLLREILRKLDDYYLSLKEGELERLTDRWRELSATLGRHIRASFRGEMVEGQAMDIDSDGALLLRLDSGFIRRLIGGDVTIVG